MKSYSVNRFFLGGLGAFRPPTTLKIVLPPLSFSLLYNYAEVLAKYVH